MINPDTNGWNENIITNSFASIEIPRILATSMPEQSVGLVPKSRWEIFSQMSLLVCQICKLNFDLQSFPLS